VLPKTKIRAKFIGRFSTFKGWTHPREYIWAERVKEVLRSTGHERAFIVLHNDPALAACLVEALPGSCIAHLFHNQLDWSPRVRDRYRHYLPHTLAVSGFTGHWVETKFDLPAGTVTTLYNGVDSEKFVPGPDQRRLDDVTDAKAIINYHGLINRNKGVDILLDSLEILAARRSDFSLQMLGNIGGIHGAESVDDFSRGIEDSISRLRDLGITVNRYGYVPWQEMPLRLASAAIHVVPSRWEEPFPLAALEGMACGLATVTSTRGGLPELIGDAGMTFEAEDSQTLANHLELLIADPDVRAHYGDMARRRAEEFPWARTWGCLRDYLAFADDRSMSGGSVR
jgi:glycosyltransferase involved in cell wall biosynthesis